MNAVTAIRAASARELELTILMPCLNEAETLAVCIRQGEGLSGKAGISGEVLIADNGSTDGSQDIAAAIGARVVPVAEKGYGAALLGGIAAANGRFIIMGDADDSYDFGALEAFVARLRTVQTWSWAIASKAASSPVPCRRCTVISAIRC